MQPMDPNILVSRVHDPSGLRQKSRRTLRYFALSVREPLDKRIDLSSDVTLMFL